MAITLNVQQQTNPFVDWAPIPLTPFEAMMVFDERPTCSMSCAAEFFFDGTIQRDAFNVAHDRAIDRHKLLGAVIEGQGKQQRWRPAPVRPTVRWQRDDVIEEFAHPKQFDLSRETGVRTWVNTVDGRSVLRFDFHHACCDAVGGMSFVEDIFVIYDAIVGGYEPNLRAFDGRRLAQRSRVPLEVSPRAKMYRTYVDLKKSLRLAFTKPAPIPVSGGGEMWQDRFVVRRLSRENLARLRYAASDASVTLNDLLLSEFLCALRDWVCRDPRGPSGREHIRVITPMSLRDRQDKLLPAANKIGFSFLSRSIDCLRDAAVGGWSNCVSRINAEVDQARRLRLPGQFLKKLRIARVSQRWFESLFSDQRCWATAIMTQLGDPTRRFDHRFPRDDGRIVVGDLLLTDFVSCPPLRPLTRAALSTNAYGNVLTMTMRCDPETISRNAAEEFMDQFVDRLMPRRAKAKSV